MYAVMYFGLSLVQCVYTTQNFHVGYHDSFGIPEADRIRKWEERNVLDRTGDFGPRIVGGVLDPPNNYPFFAGVLIDVPYRRESVCGSSLLTPSRLVTAAHCWWDGTKQASKFTVILGTPYLYLDGIRIQTDLVVMHPQFSPYTKKNDIAIIYLPRSVRYDANIAPIDLPRGRELLNDFLGMWAVATGFGKTHRTQKRSSSLLRHVNLQVMPVTQCHTAIYEVSDTNICTRGNGPVGICHGDSGGPLAIYLNGRPVLIGISSMVSERGCDINLPSVFTRVTSYYGFIINNL